MAGEERLRRVRLGGKLVSVLIGTISLLAPSTLVSADHYGNSGDWWNNYIIGWNTETSYHAGQTSPECGDDHYRWYSRVNIYGYQSYSDPYLNWMQLYDGASVGSNWIYGVSYYWGTGSSSILIDSYEQSISSSQYYFLSTSVSSSDGDVTLFMQAADPNYIDSFCAAYRYHILQRVG